MSVEEGGRSIEAGSVGVDPIALLDAIPDPVVVVGADAVLRWGNAAATATFGWDRAEWTGRDASELVHPDDVATALTSLRSVTAKSAEAGSLVEIRIRDRHGTYRWVEVRGGSAMDIVGVEGVVLVARDLTDRRRWEVASGDAAALTAVVDALPTITLVLTHDGRIRSANRALTRLLGHNLEHVLGRPLTDFVTIASTLVVSDQLLMVADGSGRVSFEVEMLSAEGAPRPMSLTIVDMADDGVVDGLVATATDIGELVAARERLRHAATHDGLTGLPNRWLLAHRLEAALSAPLGGRVGLVFLGVERFKAVNDRHGHLVGDSALVEVANRLVSCVRDSDTVGRFGGDEFMVLVAGTDEEGLERLVDRFHWTMQTPVEATGPGQGSETVTLRLALRAGWVIAEPGEAADDVLARADTAMYRAKLRRRGRGR